MTLPTESEILAAVRKRLGREKDLTLWRMNQGAGHMVTKERLLDIVTVLGSDIDYETRIERAERMIRDVLHTKFSQYGLVNGASDLIGMLTYTSAVVTPPSDIPHYLIVPPLPLARFFALEIKAPRGRVSKDQSIFLDLVRKRGGFGAVIGLGCKTILDALAQTSAALERARRGE